MYWINLIGSAFITGIAVLYTFINLSSQNVKIKNKILFLCFFSLFLTFLLMYTNGLRKLCFTCLILFLNYYIFCSERNINKSFFYSFTVIFLSSVGEFIFTLILLIIINFLNYNFSDTSLTLIICTIFNSIFLIFLSRNNSIRRKIIMLENSNKFFRYIIFFIILIIFILLFKNHSKFGNRMDFYLNMMLYIGFLIILLFLYKNVLKNQKVEIQYNQMLEYVTKYEGIINEQGKKNHEYNNQLMILSWYLEDKKYKKVKEYLSTIIGEHKTGQNYKIRQLSNFPNGGLKGLIYYKINKMEENNVKYYLYVSQDIQKEFDKFDVAMYQDITKVFGVFIDNAIEAAKDSDKKEVEIDIKLDEDFITITISNSYISDEISKVGKIGYSTKGKGHGYGLSLVKDIIRKNNRLETSNDYNDEYYTQTFLIDIKK